MAANPALERQRELAIALKRLQALENQECFDPKRPNSRPTELQKQALDDISTIPHRYILGGNQCFFGETQVLMADSATKNISDVKIGERVLTFDLKLKKLVPSTVTAVWVNENKSVNRYTTGVEQSVLCTPNHKFLAPLGGKIYKREISKTDMVMQMAAETPDQIDKVDSKYTELLGFLLGDGCFTKIGNQGLQFTNMNKEILDHVEGLLDNKHHFRPVGNGDYFISCDSGKSGGNHYINWIRSLGLDGHYAYNKFIPEYVFSESLDTRRKFIGGLIATDGWLGSDGVIGFSSTSIKLVTGLRRLLASVGIFSSLKTRSRNNPNHRDEHTIIIAKKGHVNKFINDIKVPGKRLDIQRQPLSYKPYGSKNITSVEENVMVTTVYDITVDHHDHNYVANGYLVSNSGKSMLCGREAAWILTNTHPTFVRPERWGKGSLTLIIIGRTTTQVEEELWDNKIKPFLVEGEYHETRQGTILHKVVHNPTGNRILFFSHHSPDEAREKMQAYLAHWLWLDEMPTSFKLLEELHRRCQSYGGRFIASFTPKAVSAEIRKVVDSETPYQKVYRLKMLSNPINLGREEELVASMAGLPEDYRRTLLEGTWYLGDMAVYKFSESHSIIKLPYNYQQSWRHVQAVDPAASSTAGHVLLAENPESGKWIVIRADYLKGASARELLAFAERSTFGVNIVKRVCDPAASWFMKHAQEDGYRFVGVYKKNERKKELIKNLQEALDNGLVQICDGLQDLINEFTSCQWSETAADKIVGARRFHLLDALQYAIDNLPQQKAAQTHRSYEQWMRQKHKENLLEEAANKNQPKHKPGRIVAKRGKVVYRGPNTASYNSR